MSEEESKNVLKAHRSRLAKTKRERAREKIEPLPEEDFFAKYGNELVCITSWLAEPRFTVNELVAAIEAKIRSNK